MAKNPKPLRKHKRKFYRAMQRSGTTFHESDAAQFRQPNNSTDVHKEAP